MIWLYLSRASQPLLHDGGRSSRFSVHNLRLDRHENPPLVGGPLPQSLVQVLVVPHEGVVPRGAVEVDPTRTERGQNTWGNGQGGLIMIFGVLSTTILFFSYGQIRIMLKSRVARLDYILRLQ